MQTLIKKKVLYFFLLICLSVVSNAGYTQISYIQVSGEANLTVFLDGEKKGVTSTELGGLIIEGVAPGNHLIKVVKKDFVPFEETIVVKSGEVLLYKVKPFSKVAVFITEKGNEEETDKKATIQTGKLIVQSVPIEITITIPNVEGIKDKKKAKDQWIIENLPAGSYQAFFTFNDKKIEKQLLIKPNDETRVFVNMLSGEINTQFLEENKKQLETKNQKQLAEELQQMSSLTKFTIGQTLDELKEQKPELYKGLKKATKTKLASEGDIYFGTNIGGDVADDITVFNGRIIKIGFHVYHNTLAEAAENFVNIKNHYQSLSAGNIFTTQNFSNQDMENFSITSASFSQRYTITLMKSRKQIHFQLAQK